MRYGSFIGLELEALVARLSVKICLRKLVGPGESRNWSARGFLLPELAMSLHITRFRRSRTGWSMDKDNMDTGARCSL